MKRFFQIAWNVDTSPLHLCGSLVLAVYVMMFVNIVIGGMGGIPTFAGVAIMFYLLRSITSSGNRITHQLAISSKQEVRSLYWDYILGYIVVWVIMKMLSIAADVSGWGTIDGITVSQFMNYMYGSTLLERWAYFFVAIVMFAFIFSLFPLIVIKKKKTWFLYLFFDFIIFIALSFIVSGICQLFIDPTKKNRAKCLLDYLLLCKIPHQWQSVMYIVIVLLFLLVTMIVSYKLAVFYYSPKPAKLHPNPEELKVLLPEREKKQHRILVIGTSVMVLCAIFVICFLLGTDNSPTAYKVVAECVTEDEVLGPMVMDGDFYIPVERELQFDENTTGLGYLAYKEQNCSSRFYALVIANVLYETEEPGGTYLQLYGADINSYRLAEEVEEMEAWKADYVFLLWDEEWTRESAYHAETSGYTICDKQFIVSLENQYGQVAYDEKDFEDYDAYFTIRSYREMSDIYEDETTIGNWVGCILVKDNKFYYGNKENPITGVYLQELLSILGGYEGASENISTEIDE